MKKILAVLFVMVAFVFSGCGTGQNDAKKNEVYVYTWGDYLDPATLEMFEKETGIHVVLDTFDTNESMYPRVSEGAVHYDVICPSDYMIQKMIDNGLLQPLDFNKLPEVKYSVPYAWGTVGIMYNTKKVDDNVDSWNILWNEKYKDRILMQDSPRDAFMIPLKMMGRSLNETDKDQLERAKEMLIKQKPLVQAYVIDEVKDKMISGEADIGVVFSGEALLMTLANPDLKFALPKEGTNVWIDSWVITKDSENVDNAHKFIDFMCRPDIAVMNFDALGYPTPNTAVYDLEENEDYKNSPVAFPDPSTYENQETYKYLGNEMDAYYNRLWMQVKVD